MEDQNVSLDDLHMDILEKHHRDNMQIMASMLARVGSARHVYSQCIRMYSLHDFIYSKICCIAELCTPLYIGVATN